MKPKDFNVEQLYPESANNPKKILKKINFSILNKMLEILLEIGVGGNQIDSRYQELELLFQNFYFYIYEIKQTLLKKKESKEFLEDVKERRVSEIGTTLKEL